MALDPLIVTLAVTAGAFILFVTEAIRPAYTAIMVMVSLMLFGVLTPDQGLSGPGAGSTIAVLCMFILATGIERTGAINDLAHRILALAHGKAVWSFLLLALFTGILSAALNNTPVIVLVIPLVMTVAKRAGVSPSRFLLPLSYAAILGGTMTLIGTSTNLVGSGMSELLGYGEFDMFTFLPVGIVLFVVGLLYLVFVAPRITPERRATTSAAERYGLSAYVCELTVMEGSPLVGQTVAESDLRFAYDVRTLRVYRGGRPVVIDPYSLELVAGDVLVVHAERDELVRLLDEHGLSLRPEQEAIPLEAEGRQIFEATVGQGRHLRGVRLGDIRFRHRYGASVLAVRRGRSVLHERLDDLKIGQGDTMLFLGDPGSRAAVQRSGDFLMAEAVEVEGYRREKRFLAGGIFFAVILAASLGWAPLPVSALAGVLMMGVTKCIKAHEIFESVNWEVIIVLAGLLPLGLAFIESGASGLLAGFLVDRAGALSPMAVLAIVYVITVVITQIVTNAAAVTLMAPVGAAVAGALDLDPFTFILAVTFAGSAGFLTPIGYQTNLMVYAPGEYKFTDFARVGFPLAIIVGAITVLMLGATL